MDGTMLACRKSKKIKSTNKIHTTIKYAGIRKNPFTKPLGLDTLNNRLEIKGLPDAV